MRQKVSMLMLERHRLNELDSEDEKDVSEAIQNDDELRLYYNSLDNSDRELRLRYPIEKIFNNGLVKELKLAGNFTDNSNSITKKRNINLRMLSRIAAVLVLCLIFPALYFMRNSQMSASEDRVKGSGQATLELSVFLKESRELSGNQEIPLEDQTVLSEGNTVQLAYATLAGEHYGVIFSIDGRSTLTLHYPYRKGQSPLLVSGRRTFLEEAYTLDDAPDYEVFVFVVSTKPLDVEAVLSEAQKIAGQFRFGQNAILGGAFSEFEVETITVLKK